MGATARVEAADSFAQTSPSGLEKEAMKAVSGAAWDAVRLRLQKASFQHRMIDSKAVEAIPGTVSGSRRNRSSCRGLQPSMRPASRVSGGTSLKKEKSIQTTNGRSEERSVGKRGGSTSRSVGGA